MTPKSGILISVSCIAAIAAVGSVFELSYGEPKFGNLPTMLILAASVPACGFLFWAAVKDTRANQK
ncbi:MAG: hypothetical protein BRC47_15845 [Cyanobacteria bacterium QS_7_48_42]|nr:MAG: hypothetical protein BRC36_15520 [Cyanobacteria bacterium QH_2_48_84]PSO69640.1 MAG: hypothetical protein BRC37_17195 [Cyanobacteria bacterium QH_3_48_40]PSO86318.1 MAG: hypothetical protein BRC41_07105 [Cyanobacteria bacterium QH_9_48_43]PSO97005.1 MAG: hypothetical protein BRC48_05350 [Cyanobacteria bacterium QS_9_48_30]PSO99449.1 MAG: hypothetical protein BRC47_15845 [Cyanobacteria bacterium QS_7_48_42]PSP11070.1 MAG: hypothetical protein BRC50_12955 [Cyanobacteria bacterium SW_11_4